jgi:uncharacterized protein (TIGR03000 family)
MYSLILSAALSGAPVATEPDWSRTGGGIPLPPGANSFFLNLLNEPPVGLGSAPAVLPVVQAAPVVGPATAVVPAAFTANPIRGPTPARLLVRLPADARLTVDGAATRSPGDTRRFISPPLEPGKTFHYVLRAEVVRDGQTRVETREVTVRAGQESEVTLTVPAAGLAEK